ncbi:linear amide C-N hydrolase [Hanstruepera flava]|uniref:linear amide C-N hydrolase n=1 Tax=Hanstruepera flava TaxID=2930218 RepID=UPI0020288EE2|nr:linear amide C-N hydrolase [Hanstruepera flava]
MKNSINKLVLIFITFLLTTNHGAFACTGITLCSKDGGIVVGRTVEWALSNAHLNDILVVPRNKKFRGLPQENISCKEWKGKYGFITMTAYGQDFGPDGLNEKGLYVGVYYLPNFADYADYTVEDADKSLSLGGFMQWVLSSFSSVEEVLTNLDKIKVVKVDSKEYGGAPMPFHMKIADSTGSSKIIEIINNGEIKVYDPFLGVITNAPTYDWHLINLTNYIKLSPAPSESKIFGTDILKNFGGGSGLIGLPGDFSSPSRFVRAATFSATCRPLETSIDAVFETFRILDNFNIPIGAHVPADKIPNNMESVTQITSASDLKNKIYYFHTMGNRNIRKINLNEIDFSTVKETLIKDNMSNNQEIKDVTPMQN